MHVINISPIHKKKTNMCLYLHFKVKCEIIKGWSMSYVGCFSEWLKMYMWRGTEKRGSRQKNRFDEVIWKIARALENGTISRSAVEVESQEKWITT